MARWATQCEIAGVVFTGCRATIIDPFQFVSNYKGSVEFGNDGQPNAQMINTGVAGNKFGIQLLTNEVSNVQAMLTAVEAKKALKMTHVVEITDGLYDLNLNVITDFTQQWFTHGGHSEGWLENIILRFIAKSTVA